MESMVEEIKEFYPYKDFSQAIGREDPALYQDFIGFCLKYINELSECFEAWMQRLWE